MSLATQFFDKTILSFPKIVIIILLSILSFFGYYANDFKLDASADSLLLEGDKDLEIYRKVYETFKTKDFLMITYSPKGKMFSSDNFKTIKKLKTQLEAMTRVDSVFSLIDIPLLKSTNMKLADMVNNIQTLEKPGIDLSRAEQEILESPIFKDLILSKDAKTTAVVINLKDDTAFIDLRNRRDALAARHRTEKLTKEEINTLHGLYAEYNTYATKLNQYRHQDIIEIREIMQQYKSQGQLFLGGIAMIADDMINYIGNDLMVFGIGVLIFIIATLTIIFKELRWVALPLFSCFFAATLMFGLLGFLHWHVTVISSNFISLMLIITLSMNIHLVVRYKQLCRDFPEWNQHQTVLEAVKKMVKPCLYTSLTTIIAFCSLLSSGIKPVIDFGWMMTLGLIVTFVTSFTLFPATLVLMKKSVVTADQEKNVPFTSELASITKHHGNKVLFISVILAVITGIGISQLRVENSFINYFSKSTEIYQGMKLIDDKLGGTTPLEIVIHFKEAAELDLDKILSEPDTQPSHNNNEKTTTQTAQNNQTTSVNDENLDLGDDDLDLGNDDDLDDDLLDIESNPADNWFTSDKMATIKKVHDYLESVPEVGKVISMASVIRVGEDVNQGKQFDSFELAVVYKLLPKEIKEPLVDPYISIEKNQARVSIRIMDSRPDLRRKELLERIKNHFKTNMGFKDDEITVTGMLVMYNNMLQSLFKSQILTLGFVMLGIAMMFIILFRSVLLSIIGIVPNLLAACTILGIMGLANIPLDMMTITIAAITIGIAVDNAIHYIYRFREEFRKNNDYNETLDICHANIGKAVFYTSITIIFGFSILALSNFIPTILFGMFTALAMFIALLAALTLLPKLILVIKPFKPS